MTFPAFPAFSCIGIFVPRAHAREPRAESREGAESRECHPHQVSAYCGIPIRLQGLPITASSIARPAAPAATTASWTALEYPLPLRVVAFAPSAYLLSVAKSRLNRADAARELRPKKTKRWEHGLAHRPPGYTLAPCRRFLWLLCFLCAPSFHPSGLSEAVSPASVLFADSGRAAGASKPYAPCGTRLWTPHSSQGPWVSGAFPFAE